MSSRLTPTLTHGSGDTPDESADAGTRMHDVPAADATENGRRLGRYVVMRQIGEGGMGVVYSAYDELLARRVALKLVRTDASGSAAHARILREAQALARLAHPNVVALYEVSAAAGQVFLAMEYVEGDTLRAWTSARRPGASLRELLDMYIQAGRGLAAAHAAGLVHRDFKPDNVLVGVDGRARVADFGLVAAPTPVAGAEGVAPRLEFTAVGGLLGTPAYMSPEQFAGQAADARSDQFSFCVVVYEAVCGVRPFSGAGVDELRAAVSGGQLRAPPAELPAWLWALLRRGLARDPADRFASMDELLAGLARDPAELRRRRRRIAGVVAISAVAAVVLALLVQDIHQRWQRNRREEAAGRALAATEARVVEARGDGDRTTAERVFAAYVEDPLHEGTAALARAWLGESERRAGDGERDAARAALASAYLTASSDELQAEALVGLIRHFHAGAEFDEFAQAFELLERTHPAVARGAGLAAIRVEAALARRDLAGARQAVAEQDSSPQRRLVEALAGATPTVHRQIDEIAINPRHVLLVSDADRRWTLHLARRDPALTPVRSEPLPDGVRWVSLVSSDPFLAIATEHVDNTLIRVDEHGLTRLHRWPEGVPFVATAADLDGDGVRELYTGGGAHEGIATLVQGADGTWSREIVHSHAETLDSSVHDLLALDVDGDGREELVAALEGWHAFDLRVLRREPGTRRLLLVARDKLGASRGLAGVNVAGERLLAANHLHIEGNPLVFPPGRPAGEPEGVYLFAFAGDRLIRREHLAPPTRDHWGLWAGDVDGDEREDLAVRSSESLVRHSLLQLQAPDGGFMQVHVGHLRILGLAQLDDDAPREIVAEIEDGDSRRAWVLGAGAEQLPRVVTASSGEAALVDPDSASWTRQAGDATALADLGLHVEAAEAFHGLGRRAGSSALRGEAYLKAASLRERAGRSRDAVDLYRAAAAEPAVAAAAYPELLRAQLRVGDYDDAGETLAAALAVPDLGEAARGELNRRYGRLAAGISERVDLDLRGPLAPAWDLVDARALRRDGDGLVIETLAPGVLMALPLELSGDLLELQVDVSLRQFEWSTYLEFGLVRGDDPRGEMPVKLRVASSGTSRGGFLVTRHFTCEVAGRPLVGSGASETITHLDEPVRVSMRVAFTAAVGDVGCEIREHDGPRARHNRLAGVPLPPGGRYLLVVRASNEVPAWLDATIHRISLRGATVRDEPPADPRRAALQRAVLARDAGATLSAVQLLAEPTRRERVWQADALMRLGRRGDAEELWSRLLVGAALDRDLASRLRGEPGTYGPQLHALDPAGQPRRLATVWRNTAVNHLGVEPARRAMAAALAGLDVDAALVLADEATRGDLADLLGWRARLWAHAGEPGRARVDLERALELVATLGPEAAQRGTVWLLWIDLASLAAAEADPGRAREAIRWARASSATPMLVDDVVRARPALATLDE